MSDFRARFGKASMELLGTAILVLTIQLAVANAGSMAPLAIGGVLVTIVYAGGPISGAHYNPAVSLAICVRGKMSFHEMIMYWVFQIAGGYLGGLLGGIISGAFAMISLGKDFSTTQAFLAEVIFTLILCFVVLAVATNSQVANNHYYGAAIGLVVMVGALSVGPISGGAFNPAVALGLSLSKGLANLPYVLAVVVANLLGGLGAAACFYMVAPEEFPSLPTGTTGERTPLV